MGCIYYQDEIGICCKKDGFTWETIKEFRCKYQLKNMDDCPIGITVRQAERMKDKLEAIKNLCYGKDHIIYWVRREDIGKILHSSTPR